MISATLESEAGVPVLHLDWFIGGPIDPTVTVFVHVQDANGQVVAQADGDLIGGYVPIGMWQTNDRVEERRPLILPDLPPGEYRIAIGLYNRQSLQRTNPTQVSGNPVIENALIVGEFEQR